MTHVVSQRHRNNKLFYYSAVNFNHKLYGFFNTVNKMNLQEVGCEYMDWIYLAQNRDRWRALVNAVVNVWVP